MKLVGGLFRCNKKLETLRNTPDGAQYLLRHLLSLSLPLRRVDDNLQASESAARQRARDRDGAFIHNRVRHPVSVLNDHFISFQRAVSRRVRAGGTGCIAPHYSFKRKLFENLANIRISNVF